MNQHGGIIKVVDWSALNWLSVLFNTMEEFVRASTGGAIISNLATKFNWKDPYTLDIQLHPDVYFQDGTKYDSDIAKLNFIEEKRWFAPHPPGTWLNFPDGSEVEIINEHNIIFHFTRPEGLALGKLELYIKRIYCLEILRVRLS